MNKAQYVSALETMLELKPGTLKAMESTNSAKTLATLTQALVAQSDRYNAKKGLK